MVRVIYGVNFLKSARKLDKKLQEKLAKNIEILQRNPFSSTLHTKNLAGKLSGFFSFRITRDWRVVFQFIDPETVRLIEVAHRRDIYR